MSWVFSTLGLHHTRNALDVRTGVNQHASNGAGGDARLRQVGAAGEDDRHLCADDNSGQVRATEIFQLLGEHIARFEVRHKQDVSISGDGRFQLFLRRWGFTWVSASADASAL